MKNIYTKIGILLFLGFITSCNDFLDENPDKRTQVKSKETIEKLLVSAYPTASFAPLTEFSSDNVDDLGSKVAWSYKEYNMFYWKDVSEKNGDTPSDVWESAYKAIANANKALDAIKKSPEADNLKPQKGEALVARAYAHFILVNIFGRHYNTQTSDTDLGVYYMTDIETTLDPKYKRESVADVYKKIEKDLLEGLPLIDDNVYKQPKYHFNKAAANAFAARFYLYYEKWDKAEKYATEALGENPEAVLKDWEELSSGKYEQYEEQPREYGSFKRPANLLIAEVPTLRASYFYFGSRAQRFHHTPYLSQTETLKAFSYYGEPSFFAKIYTFVHPYNTTGFYTIPLNFRYTDEVAGIGNYYCTEILFSTDEALLIRAEARVMQKKNDLAIADLTIWAKNFCKNPYPFTENTINNLFNGIEYSTDDNPTQKKKLNPKFSLEPEQENLIHAVLQSRRVLTLHEGLRWFDIKRYGIEISRREFKNKGTELKQINDFLGKDDPRRAIQLPLSAIRAGLEANPR